MPTAREFNRAMQQFADIQRTPLQRARSAYMRGEIDVEEFERRVDELLNAPPPKPQPWDCATHGHVWIIGFEVCRECGENWAF
jgi:hypothetical protein